MAKEAEAVNEAVEANEEQEELSLEEAFVADMHKLQGDISKGTVGFEFSEEEEAKEPTEEAEEGSKESKEVLSEKEKGLIEELKAERTKRQEAEKKSSDFDELRKEIEALKTKPKEEDPWEKITDEQLIQGELYWEKQYQLAVRDENTELEQKAFNALAAIRQEQRQRPLKKAEKKPESQSSKPTAEQEGTLKELQKVDDLARKAVPDFYKEGTTANTLLLEKAKEFPGILSLGEELGGLIVGALVMLEHPELVGGKITKKVGEKLNEQIHSALTSKSGSEGGRPTNVRQRTHKENLAIAEQIKLGLRKGL